MRRTIKYLIAAFLILYVAPAARGNDRGSSVSGRVVDAATGEAVSGAVINLVDTYLWAVSDADGDFRISGVRDGTYQMQVSFLGYVTASLQLTVRGDASGLVVRLKESSLAIEEVVVTAQAGGDNPNTTFVIGDDALKHMQVSNVADVAALLPGGKTVNPDLTRDGNNAFSLRDGGETVGNAKFGTAVEVDGIRIGNNASFGAPDGVDTRNIAVANIESVEVLTGVPSAEYGDLNSGIVKIRTRKGHTPWNVLLSANPRTWQTSLAKGFDLGGDRGTLNVSGEWVRATKSLVSPYTSYTRRGLSAVYGNTFRRVLRFEAGVSANFGGMNTEDDPDAYTGEYIRERANFLRAHTSLTWLLNKSWITNLRFDASVNYSDDLEHAHLYYSYASEQPAVHATQEGYYIADKLPYTFFADRMVDSKELDWAASLKYDWSRRWGRVRSSLKAGVQWKATGNVGRGEYYLDPTLAPHQYRPRPYTSYPYMHNVALYAEERVTFPVGKTELDLTAGVRMENLFVRGTQYDGLNSLSPRLNLRWRLADGIAVRGGWGVIEKLPSYYVLYPEQEYRDIQTFGFSYNNNESSYIYYTQPFTLLYNENLRWQRNHNAEVGVELDLAGLSLSLVGYYNRTKLPYKYSVSYTPFSYNVMQLPDGYTVPSAPQVKVDPQTGMVWMRGGDGEYWVPMDVKVTDRTFVRSTWADNGSDIVRKGVELVVDFPEINPIRTQIRLDAAYTHTKYVDSSLAYYYQTGWSHTSLPNRSYQYVGIYATGSSSSTTANGRITQSLDANLTAVTHIPSARIIISCRLEMSLLKRSQNLSLYDGREYAFNVGESDNNPTGGSIYDGNSYTAVWPVAYMDFDGNVRPFTEVEAAMPEFAHLILKSNNAYTFAPDGYAPYFSANISITKEIGDHVSLSFFANNFTNSRRYVVSYATGVGAIFTPSFYYGLTCRLKF